MDTFWIVLLGILQGATEFLPVSSSGHLAAAQLILDGSSAQTSLSDQPLTLEILLHLATLFAVVVYFRSSIYGAILGAARAVRAIGQKRLGQLLRTDEEAGLAVAVVVGTLPTGILGLALKDGASWVSADPVSLGLTFLVCSVLLFASRFWPGGTGVLTIRTALIVGCVQGLAVLPGISRSGATIATCLWLGLPREEAARFSFLLSLPAILGAALLELDGGALLVDQRLFAYLLGGLAAFVTGLVALYILVQLVRRGRLWLFAPYVAAVGLAVLIFV